MDNSMLFFLLATFTALTTSSEAPTVLCKVPTFGTLLLECHTSKECCTHFQCFQGVCLPAKPAGATSVAFVSQLLVEDAAATVNAMQRRVTTAVTVLSEADRASGDKSAQHLVQMEAESLDLYNSFRSPGSMDPDTSKQLIRTRVKAVTTRHQASTNTQSSAERIAELEREVEKLKEKLKRCGPARNGRSGEGRGRNGPPREGMEGGPCGKTNYKDFGKCKESGKRLFCQEAGIVFGSGWIPGTCMQKQEGAKRRRMLLEFQVDENATIGSKNGPCGKTPYFDFGSCVHGTICKRDQPTQYAPGICKSSNPDAKVHKSKHHPKKTGGGRHAKKLRESAVGLAVRTAQDIANEMSTISDELLGAAAHLRAAAEKLKYKDGDKLRGPETAPADNESGILKAEKKRISANRLVSQGNLVVDHVSGSDVVLHEGLVDTPLLFILVAAIGMIAMAVFHQYQKHSRRWLYQRL